MGQDIAALYVERLERGMTPAEEGRLAAELGLSNGNPYRRGWARNTILVGPRYAQWAREWDAAYETARAATTDEMTTCHDQEQEHPADAS